jgi:DNA-binding CsgD family transcriptional regulator
MTFPTTAEPAQVPATDLLSTRLLQVLEMTALGATNTQMATRLGVGDETVKTHMKRLMAALGARSRAEAVGIGYRMGLLPVPVQARPAQDENGEPCRNADADAGTETPDKHSAAEPGTVQGAIRLADAASTPDAAPPDAAPLDAATAEALIEVARSLVAGRPVSRTRIQACQALVAAGRWPVAA